ncbi:MAG: HAD-IA family hydrolase [Candidatus Heimdallarchaeota archaeon]|nr:HAD-IA family hydrolase [Candidatus Heimdallarchaeota archaeon]
MSKLSGVLFDFDGVLSSVMDRLGRPFFQVYKKIRPTATKEDILFSLRDIVELLMRTEKGGRFYIPKMIIKISQLLQFNFLESFQFFVLMMLQMRQTQHVVFPIPGGNSVLGFATKRFKTALVTSAKRKVIKNAFRVIPNLKQVDIVITKEHVNYIKPNPEGILIALKKLGLQPEECVFVGDLPVDIIAGKRAGVTTIAVVNFQWAAQGKHQMLAANSPEYIINTITELPSLLEKIENIHRKL